MTLSQDDETRRRVASAGAEWAGPSRRARAIAVVAAIAFAAITFAVVSRVWRHAAPPPSSRPTSVEVKLIATPSAAPTPASR
jgi:hypothetical protein